MSKQEIPYPVEQGSHRNSDLHLDSVQNYLQLLLKKKLAVAQRSMEKLLLNITRRDKIRNEIIRSKQG